MGSGLRLVVVGILVVIALSVTPSMVAGSIESEDLAESPSEISDCQKITEPGKYILTEDIDHAGQNSCIEIVGTDAVVLDGNGFTINNTRVGLDVRESSNVTVKNVIVRSSEVTGINVWNSESIKIQDNIISNTGTTAIWRNNSIHVWESTDIQINNNTVTATLKQSDGIYVGRSSNVNIYRNNVQDATNNGINVIQSEHINIYQNYLIDVGVSSGPKVDGDTGINSWETNDVDIYNNTLVNTSNRGISAGRTSNVAIYGNVVINTHWWSIFVGKSKTIVIDNNSVENPDTGANAIAFSDVINVTASNNYVDEAMYGIEAKPNSTNVVIRNNLIKNTILCSIEAEGHNPGESDNPGRVSNVVIENNTAESAGPLGVWVNTSEIIVRDNTVKNASGLGMYVRGIDGPVEIYGNTFVNSTSAAIRINDSHDYLRIYENEFRRLDTGLRLLNSADIRVERNRFIDVIDNFEERNTSGIEKHNNTDNYDYPAQPGFGPLITLFAIIMAVILAGKRIDG